MTRRARRARLALRALGAALSLARFAGAQTSAATPPAAAPNTAGDLASFGARIAKTDEKRGTATLAFARKVSYVVLAVVPRASVEPLVDVTGAPALGRADKRSLTLPVLVADPYAPPRTEADRTAEYATCVQRLTKQYYVKPPPLPTSPDSGDGNPRAVTSDMRSAEADATETAKSKAERECTDRANAEASQTQATRDFAEGYLLLLVAETPFAIQDFETSTKRLVVRGGDDDPSNVRGVAEALAAGHGAWAAHWVPWTSRRPRHH